MNRQLILLFLIVENAMMAFPQAPANVKDTIISFSKFEVVNFRSSVFNDNRQVYVYKTKEYRGPASGITIYMLDALLDIEILAALTEKLTSAGAIPPAMVIGIGYKPGQRVMNLTPDSTKYLHNNNPDTTGLFARSGGGKQFLKFIHDDIIPFIETKYGKSPYRALMGHSLAVMFTNYVMMNMPDLFNGYVASSPAISYNLNQQLQQAAAFFETFNGPLTTHFVSMANEEQTGLYPKNILSNYTSSVLKNKNGSIRFSYRSYPTLTHNTAVIYSYADGLRFLFEGYEVDLSSLLTSMGGNSVSSVIKSYFEKLSKKLGFPIHPSETMLRNWAFELMYVQKKPKLAIDLFEYSTKLFPDSFEAFSNLGEIYLAEGDKQRAKENFEKSLQLNSENEYVKSKLKQINDGK